MRINFNGQRRWSDVSRQLYATVERRMHTHHQLVTFMRGLRLHENIYEFN